MQKKNEEAKTRWLNYSPSDHNADRAFLLLPQDQGSQPRGSGFPQAQRMAPVMCTNELCAEPLLKSSREGHEHLTGPPNIRHVCVSRAMNHRGLERSFI